jgi:opacity protein-like surface antigen
MRNSFAVATILAVLASSAIAQTQNPPAQDSPQNSAINSPDSSNRQVTAPVSGANSFTEGQARSRIEKMGFADVTDLKKDDNGVWRGRAMKGGQMVDVSVDFQGNVIQAGTQGAPMPGNTVPATPRDTLKKSKNATVKRTKSLILHDPESVVRNFSVFP